MHPTHRALAAIDRDFYSRHADAFDRTRGAPWEGWEPVAEWARQRIRARNGRLALLDLGCGNGRFSAFLESRLGRAFDAYGLDASVGLLARARANALRDRRRARWIALDLFEDVGVDSVRRTFDLIVAFGLLHHVPGRERRTQLLRDAGTRLADGGRMFASFWQFGDDPRFAPRMVDPVSFLERAGKGADGLEPGDHLLRWGPLDAAEGPLRYCHHTSDEEAEELVEASGLRLAERYHADGKTGQLNLYVALEK